MSRYVGPRAFDLVDRVAVTFGIHMSCFIHQVGKAVNTVEIRQSGQNACGTSLAPAGHPWHNGLRIDGDGHPVS